MMVSRQIIGLVLAFYSGWVINGWRLNSKIADYELSSAQESSKKLEEVLKRNSEVDYEVSKMLEQSRRDAAVAYAAVDGMRKRIQAMQNSQSSSCSGELKNAGTPTLVSGTLESLEMCGERLVGMAEYADKIEASSYGLQKMLQ